MNHRVYNIWRRRWLMRLAFFVALAIIFQSARHAPAENEKAVLPARPHWSASRVIGSPEPPPPYTVEPVFTQIKWKNPVFAIREPDSERLIVIQWPEAIAAPPEVNSRGNDKPQPLRFTPARVLRVLDRPGDQSSEPFLE